MYHQVTATQWPDRVLAEHALRPTSLCYVGGTSEIPARTSRERTLAGMLRNTWENLDPQPSQRQIAKLIGCSNVQVGRYLKGETRITVEIAASLLTAMGVVGDLREDILKVARGEAGDQPWTTSGPTGVSAQLAGTLDMESNALAMFEWSPLFVPGLLQSKRYAKAIISKNKVLSPSEVDHLVTLRLGRQHSILRDDPLDLTAIVGVPAIQGRIGGDEVMIDQLRHLLKVSERDAVTLRLAEINGDWNGGLLGSFIVYTFDGLLPSIVALEHHRTGSFVDDPKDVEGFKTLAADLRESAYTPDESRDLINDQIQKRETTR